MRQPPHPNTAALVRCFLRATAARSDKLDLVETFVAAKDDLVWWANLGLAFKGDPTLSAAIRRHGVPADSELRLALMTALAMGCMGMTIES
jgi:hypothetical protein